MNTGWICGSTTERRYRLETALYATVYRILTNPAYGGTYAYGKTGASTVYDSSSARQGVRRKPREEWLALRPATHEGYVAWERAEAIRQMIIDNNYGREHRGAAKHGDALLAGILRCRCCGRKLTVRYTGDSELPAEFRHRLASQSPPTN